MFLCFVMAEVATEAASPSWQRPRQRQLQTPLTDGLWSERCSSDVRWGRNSKSKSKWQKPNQCVCGYAFSFMISNSYHKFQLKIEWIEMDPLIGERDRSCGILLIEIYIALSLLFNWRRRDHLPVSAFPLTSPSLSTPPALAFWFRELIQLNFDFAHSVFSEQLKCVTKVRSVVVVECP